MNKFNLSLIKNIILLSKPSKAIHLLLMVLFVSSFANVASAATITSAQTGNWNATSTWAGGVVPSLTDAVIIAANHTVTVNGTFTCASLVIGTNNNIATLTFSGTTPQLTVTGSVVLGNATNSNRRGVLTFINGSKLVAGSVTNGNNGANGTITMTAGGILETGSFATSTGTWTPGTGTVVMTATNTIPNTIFTSFNNLTISAGTTTFGAVKTITNNFSIATGSSVNLGTFTHTAGTLTLAGVAQVPESWGSTSSLADNKNNTYFAATTGVVNNSCTGPSITAQPTALTICENTGGTFTVATSATTPTYQWQYSSDNINWTNIDATLAPYVTNYATATLTLSNIPLAYNANYVRCAVRSSTGCRTNSNSVQLTVNASITTGVGTVPYQFCIDNSNTITTAVANSGQYVVLDVIKGYNYTFAVGNAFSGNEYLTVSDNADATNAAIVTNNGTTGTSITNWIATLSGRIKIKVSTNNCTNGTTGLALTLTLNSLNNTQDSQTASGTNTWIGHIYNSVAGSAPEPFTNANYAGYYNVGTETISEGFGGDNACFSVFSNGTQRASIYTDQFAVRYRLQSTRAAGYYFMNANADDGIRVTVDGVSVLNDWTDHANTQYCNNLVYLTGSSNIVLDYYEYAGGNVVGVNFAAITGNSISSYADINVCSGTSPGTLDGSNLLSCTGTTNTTYQWQSSTDNINFTNISGATSEDYTPPTITTTTTDVKYYRRVLKAFGVPITASNPATGSVKVTTNPPAPSTPGTITGSATQCAGNTLQTYSVAAVTNATSYNWTLPANWTITAGAGTNSITVSIASNGTTGNVSVNAANGCGTSGSISKWVTVSVPTVAGTVTPANTNVCSGSNSTNLSLSGQTGSILRWESSTDNFAGGPITTIASTGSSITALNLTVDTYYRAVVQNGSCNVLNTSSVKLTVVGAMANPGGISIDGVPYPVNGSTTNCASTTMTFSIASVANATSYTWSVGTGWNILSGQGTTTVSVSTGTTSQSNNISVYATNGTCPQTGSTYLWVTLTTPAAPTGAATQTFCSGATVANLSATGSNIKWYAAVSGGAALASTTVLTNGTHYYASQNPSGCESTTRFDVTATVTAVPTITGIVTPATCSNGSDGAITITGLYVPIEFKKADNDNIDLGSSFLSNKTAFTVEGWVKFDINNVGSRMSLFGQNDVVEFYLNTNTIELWTPNTGVITTPLTAAIGNNAWHHIAATGNATSTNIYIDGVLKVSGSGTANYGTSAYNAQIGSGVVDPLTPSGGGFTGHIEKVGFYSSALSAGTLATLASSPTTYIGTETGIIAGYNFYEGSGTTLTSLPAGKNGTFGNSPQWVYSYAWTKTGTPAFTASTKNISGLSPGDYNLTISSLGGGCPINKTFTVGSINTAPSTPTVGTITQPNCSTPTGSVVLSGLPVSGTLNQTGTVTNSYTITGTSMTISGLAAGTYAFSVSNGSCTSSSTGNVIFNAVVTNTWNGTAWDNGTPTASQALIFNGNYPPTPDPNVDITGCSCTINSGKNVTIKTGRNLIITNEVTVIGTGTLTFENNASLIQTNNVTNVGSITYKRATTTIREFDFTYWSSPVAGQKLLDVSPTTKLDKFFSFNAAANDWVQETPSTTTMDIGKGYIIRGIPLPTPPAPGFYEASFIGVPNNGPQSIAVVSGVKYNLIGNPYPSAIDADAFILANTAAIDGTLYFWTHNTPIAIGTPDPGTGVWAYSGNDYATYTLSGGTGTAGNFVDANGNGIMDSGEEMVSNRPTGKIAAGQSFFTTSTAGGGPVNFTNAMRVNGLGDALDNTKFYKTKNPKSKTTTTIEKNRVWLNLTNKQGAFKQTLVGYITGASNTWDKLYDGESFDGNDFLDFYSINDEKNLTIQGRALPFDENDEIPLGYRIAVEGTFTINIDETDGLLTDQPVFLEDKLTNKTVNLKEGKYDFNTSAGTFNDRFVLRYTSKTLGTNDLEISSNKVFVSIKNKQIKIDSFAETIDQVAIYDEAGRQIYQKNKVNSTELSISNLVSNHQILIVKTSLQNGKTVSNKIIY